MAIHGLLSLLFVDLSNSSAVVAYYAAQSLTSCAGGLLASDLYLSRALANDTLLLSLTVTKVALVSLAGVVSFL